MSAQYVVPPKSGQLHSEGTLKEGGEENPPREQNFKQHIWLSIVSGLREGQNYHSKQTHGQFLIVWSNGQGGGRNRIRRPVTKMSRKKYTPT